MQKERVFPRELVAGALEQVFLGMNILHESDVIHTGICIDTFVLSGSITNRIKLDLHADNLLIALADDSILATVEQNEIDTPIARKQIGGRFIYGSQYVLGGAGPLVISDCGQARIGAEHHGNAMPLPYRAPEVILGMQWGPEAWDLLEKEKLFDVYDSESQEHNDACHLAAMTALLGPPPAAFLEKSPVTRKFWDDDALKGDDRDTFINFVECFLWWAPEERFTALQGYMHPFLRGGTLPKDVD
ncbi:putative serine/threonine-protein kinase clkA [Beauveria bassiana]|uniref:Putative serine/threonine-protein kinase clkA n=1 Tax=Beauveria bassiana TaxID=176275 RepID=A0A2N6NCQ5_BEABA|nr:putative serine/threonine-protein kinase clkA [Beauveria bassiana]